MTIDDLIQLLNNRLREFKLSKDYARMSGDLERMNAADKEVLSLEDTLFKLNLLVDTSKSAAVKDAILAEVMTDGSIAVLGEYDISPYATDPKHEEKIMNILSKIGVMDTVEKIDDYIKGRYLSSPVTGEMIMNAAEAYTADARLMMAIMEQDSRFGTAGIAVSTLNPGNVGNNDDGDTVTYESWQEGVTAVAEWLNRHRISKIISEIPEETIAEPTATSTPLIITPTSATTTPMTATSTPQIITPTTATSTPTSATSTPVAATSTPETIPVTTSTTTTTTATSTPTSATSTPETATSTPTTATSTPTTATTTPVTATSTEETMPISTSTTTITTTATSTPTTATTTPEAATTTDETIPVATSTPITTTSTTTTATTTSEIAPIATSTPQTTNQTTETATTTQETATTTTN